MHVMHNGRQLRAFFGDFRCIMSINIDAYVPSLVLYITLYTPLTLEIQWHS